MKQIKEVLEEVGTRGSVELLTYEAPSYRGLTYETEKYYPTWVLERDHPAVSAAIETYQALFKENPWWIKGLSVPMGSLLWAVTGFPVLDLDLEMRSMPTVPMIRFPFISY